MLYQKFCISVRHQLEPDSYAKREQFATWFLENQLNTLNKVLWTEKAYFHLGRTAYIKNAFIWCDKNPYSCPKKSLNLPKLCLWIGFSGKIIVPPFFIKTGIIDGENYLFMLHHHAVQYLKTYRKILSTVYQQDGAPHHIKRNVQQFLTETFTNDCVFSRSSGHRVHQIYRLAISCTGAI